MVSIAKAAGSFVTLAIQVVGLLVFVFGVWLMYNPLGYVVAGLLAVVVVQFIAWRQEDAEVTAYKRAVAQAMANRGRPS